MSGEAEVDGLELLALAEEAPEQVETIIQMMLDADEELFDDDQQDREQD
jgi:hypothetical protein